MDNPRNNYDDQTENRDDRLHGQDTPARTNKDLTDPVRDQERLRPDETTIDLPEVKDIPGQEHVHVPPLGELADTTISSDDEEGVGLLDELNEEEEDEDSIIRMGTDADIPSEDREALERGDDFMPTRDEERLSRASMDNTDFDGEPLNEAAFGTERTGSDLDTSGIDEDDASENIGEEDEENNQWSLGGDTKDVNEERTS
ncbi:MAG TPA: hypothetical protein VD993_06295 [Chitinophagaceae bacterium]|nr:hypothetical protein [Chitinophagaceae bacterium]